ncbi:hypothetical protein CANARDRAFT_5163 [[Candida] arabinofermentans NRRL YB-2248]|uniref:Inositol polyphosphate-related phosphatase domain-containing protein n=1 Tax=[Candida] arabinofermentans NRRL YB-2248 TaxID=983967 RepID=A0A1E4T7W2_9ASCO|nr:hypothetical protein CANARDRAFT_5163 [[Candida] arabinofermentans NRRL YB-2248]
MSVEKSVDLETLALTDGSEATISSNADVSQAPTEATSASDALVNSSEIEKYRSIQLFNLLNPSNKFKYKSQLQSDYLSQHYDDLVYDENITVKLISWNLNQLTNPNPVDFKRMLELQDLTFAEVYIFNFQETVSLKSISKSETLIKQWCDYIIELLPTDKNYRVIFQTGVLGLTTIIITSEKYSSQITDIKTKKVGLGYFNWYNKGCIEVRFRLGKIDDVKLKGIEIQILNMHLVHGEDSSVVGMRKSSLQKIEDSFGLVRRDVNLVSNDDPDTEKSEPESVVVTPYALSGDELQNAVKKGIDLDEIYSRNLDKSLIVVSGDMNYRTADISRKDLFKLLEYSDFKTLLEYDQLSALTNQHELFIGFLEGPIDFRPTFKLKNLNTYNGLRLPSYTDRIFYTPFDGLKQITYESYEIAGSDHLPVLSEFELSFKAVNHEKLVIFNNEFQSYFDRDINALELLEMEPKAVTMDIVVGLEEVINIRMRNLCNELLTFKVLENDKKLFRKSEFSILNQSPNNTNELPPREIKTLKFQVKASKPGLIAKAYTVRLENFPTMINFISFTLTSKTVIGVPLALLTDLQFDNFNRSFEFLLTASKVNLVSRLKEIEHESSLVNLEKLILRDVTLGEVDLNLLTKLNNIGMVTNEASVALMNVIYLWLKHIPGDFDFSSHERGRKVFSHLMKLIQYLDIDEAKEFEYFGFLFQDETEFRESLESHFYNTNV